MGRTADQGRRWSSLGSEALILCASIASSLRLRRRGGSERGKALQIDGDRLAVGLAQFGHIANNAGHAGTENVAGRREAAGEGLDNVRVGPVQKVAASQVRRFAVTVRQRRACKRMLQVHLAQKTPWRMAFAAMAGALDEIAAGVPL